MSSIFYVYTDIVSKYICKYILENKLRERFHC
jgi:hypothetical protein